MLAYNLVSIFSTQSLKVVVSRLFYAVGIWELFLTFIRRRYLLEVNRSFAANNINNALYTGFIITDGSSMVGLSEKKWIFNGRVHNIDQKFIHGQLNKNNYTLRFIYLYLNWLPEFVTLFGNSCAKVLLDEIKGSSLFRINPSINSIGVYPLISTYLMTNDVYYLKMLHDKFCKLIISTEEYIGANHLFDNYLAIFLLSALFDCSATAEFARNKIVAHFASWRNTGFLERNRCYEILVLERLCFVIDAVRKTKKYNLCVLFDIAKNLIKNLPSAYANDSYLAKSHLEIVRKYCENYIGEIYENPVNHKPKLFFILENARPLRGGFGHAHDSNFTVCDNVLGHKIYNNLGTPTYRHSKLRRVYTSRLAYSTVNFIAPRPIPSIIRFLPFRVMLNPFAEFLNYINSCFVNRAFFNRNDRIGLNRLLFSLLRNIYIDLKVPLEFPVDQLENIFYEYGYNVNNIKQSKVRLFDGIESRPIFVNRIRISLKRG